MRCESVSFRVAQAALKLFSALPLAKILASRQDEDMIFTDIQLNIERRASEGRIYPRYEDFCISNLPSAIAFLLGAQSQSPLSEALRRAGLEPSKNYRVINFVIDGFGYDQWLWHAERIPFLRRLTEVGSLLPITSVFPSTTAAALTTLHTGLTPQQHGLTEWLVYFEELQKLIFTLPFSALGKVDRDGLLAEGADPKILFNGKTFYQSLAAAGVRSFVFTPRSYVHSAYSKLVHAGSKIVPFKHLSGAFVKLRHLLAQVAGPAYMYVYWNGFDHTAHMHGPDSDDCSVAVQKFSDLLEKQFIGCLDAKAAENVIVLVTADHGQVRVNPEQTIYLNDYPEVTASLLHNAADEQIGPWGSARDVFLSVEPDKRIEIRDFLTSTLAGKATVLETAEAIEGGLFGVGEMHPRFRSRVGDMLILPDENSTIWYEHLSGQKFGLFGLHGGLSSKEMLVPLMILRLKEVLRN